MIVPGRDSARVRQLAGETLGRAWRESGLPAGEIPALLEEVWAAEDEAAALGAARAAVGRALAPGSGAQAAYEAARLARQESLGELLAPLVPGSPVVDFGAGGPELLEELARRLPEGTELLATDIAPIAAAPNGPVRAIRQPGAAVIPLPGGAAEAIVATGVLHHVDYEAQEAVARELRRICRDGGRLLLVEECLAGGDPEARAAGDAFEQLDDGEALAFLAFTDWWGNRVMKGDDAMPVPCAFRSAAGWEELLAQCGFTAARRAYLGLGSMGGHMETPRTLLVLEAA